MVDKIVYDLLVNVNNLRWLRLFPIFNQRVGLCCPIVDKSLSVDVDMFTMACSLALSSATMIGR